MRFSSKRFGQGRRPWVAGILSLAGLAGALALVLGTLMSPPQVVDAEDGTPFQAESLVLAGQRGH